MFWSDNSVAKVVARTMDWAVSDDPVLPVRSLSPCGLGLVGDVTARLTPAALTY